METGNSGAGSGEGLAQRDEDTKAQRKEGEEGGTYSENRATKEEAEVRNPEDCVTGAEDAEVRNPEDCVTGACDLANRATEREKLGLPGMGRPGLTAEDMKGDPRYDVDAMLAGFGLKLEDIRDPGAALEGGDVGRFYAVYTVVSQGLIAKVRARAAQAGKSEMQRLLEEEEDTRDPREVAQQRAWEEKENAKGPPAPWRAVSGLGDAETERNMAPHVREAAIMALLNVVERLAEKELAKHRANPRAERTHLWDPLQQICFYLGIARAKLSRYTKELTGMAAHEVIDRLRAREVRSALCEQIKSQKLKVKNGTALDVYKALKESRRCPSWNRETFAIELGFANYRRFYRACLLYYGKTPGQLEFEICGEICASSAEGLAPRHEDTKPQRKEGDEVQFFTPFSEQGPALRHEDTKTQRKECAGDAPAA